LIFSKKHKNIIKFMLQNNALNDVTTEISSDVEQIGAAVTEAKTTAGATTNLSEETFSVSTVLCF
jgi:hypothetical protein